MNQRQRDRIVEDIAIYKSQKATRAYLEKRYHEDMVEELRQEDDAILLILLRGILDRDLGYYECLSDD